MQQYYIWTIGCQMNKSESERLAAYLAREGWSEAQSAEEADLVILNSCVVRQSAENRVTNKLHSVKSLKKRNPSLQIAVTGCFVGENLSELAKAYPFVDHFFKAGEFPEWLGNYDLLKTIPSNPGVASYISIMQGCDNFCAYCIVPYRRGREKSRPPGDIIVEASNMVGKGVREITLLGQNVNSYGLNLPGRPDLAGLLRSLSEISGLERIRFLTNHPKDMQSALIKAVADLEKVCEQINLPVQSGDDEILKAMNRGYTARYYRELIAEIRRAVPEIALSTDIIVGFPGERDSQFANTYDLLQEIRFDMVHVAAYSPRSGTAASKTLPDDVPASVKKARLEAVEKLQKEITSEINAGLLDREVEVLIEGQEKGKWYGRTRSDKLVFVQDERDLYAQLVRVKISRTSPWSLKGNLI
jgi:tRNA-2-methylthio-N6-dimethylallyladenosine synthase